MGWKCAWIQKRGTRVLPGIDQTVTAPFLRTLHLKHYGIRSFLLLCQNRSVFNVSPPAAIPECSPSSQSRESGRLRWAAGSPWWGSFVLSRVFESTCNVRIIFQFHKKKKINLFPVVFVTHHYESCEWVAVSVTHAAFLHPTKWNPMKAFNNRNASQTAN